MASERQVKIAFQRYKYFIEKLPHPGCYTALHELFQSLCRHGFCIPSAPWLNPTELAAIVNYTAMFGSTKAKQKMLFPLDKPLNSYKTFWKLAEESSEYSEVPEFSAAFILRLLYQQMPFIIAPERVSLLFDRMMHLLSEPAVDIRVESCLGIRTSSLMEGARALYYRFLAACRQTETDFRAASCTKPEREVLMLLAATRAERLQFHNAELSLKLLEQKPYELNSLLR